MSESKTNRKDMSVLFLVLAPLKEKVTVQPCLSEISFEYFPPWEMTGTVHIDNPFPKGHRKVHLGRFQSEPVAMTS